jgi:hypothetical protein
MHDGFDRGAVTRDQSGTYGCANPMRLIINSDFAL